MRLDIQYSGNMSSFSEKQLNFIKLCQKSKKVCNLWIQNNLLLCIK